MFSSTSEALAEQHHVSPRTVERAGKLVAEVEAQPMLLVSLRYGAESSGNITA